MTNMPTRIRELRDKLGMSQEELADKSGVSRTTISGLENGTERNTTLRTLYSIAGAMGVKINDLFF